MVKQSNNAEPVSSPCNACSVVLQLGDRRSGAVLVLVMSIAKPTPFLECSRAIPVAPHSLCLKHLVSVLCVSLHATVTLFPTDTRDPSCTGTASQPKKVVLLTAPPRYTGVSAYFPNRSKPKCLPVLKSFMASIGCDPLSAVSCSTKGTCSCSHTFGTHTQKN